jgi:hypothetical protein
MGWVALRPLFSDVTIVGSDSSAVQLALRHLKPDIVALDVCGDVLSDVNARLFEVLKSQFLSVTEPLKELGFSCIVIDGKPAEGLVFRYLQVGGDACSKDSSWGSSLSGLVVRCQAYVSL